jgi:hypothetical protein
VVADSTLATGSAQEPERPAAPGPSAVNKEMQALVDSQGKEITHLKEKLFQSRARIDDLQQQLEVLY